MRQLLILILASALAACQSNDGAEPKKKDWVHFGNIPITIHLSRLPHGEVLAGVVKILGNWLIGMGVVTSSLHFMNVATVPDIARLNGKMDVLTVGGVMQCCSSIMKWTLHHRNDDGVKPGVYVKRMTYAELDMCHTSIPLANVT
ncbi:hypothetical protein T492DRAFT_867261 [Pavlovales sp. CCMP2436]|nr:hypothetical protein T492DRAFT_867261 [Pavlovales sp. CCMP2436]